MAGYGEAKHAELVRINALVKAYERTHEAEHCAAGMPIQQAYLYPSDPGDTGDRGRWRYVFGNCQVVGVDAALTTIQLIASGYGLDWR